MKTSIYLFTLFLSFQFIVFGQSPASHLNTDKKNFAASGYDVTEYFNNKAIKGNKKIESVQNGATYLFRTQKNKLLFEKNPEKYTPQYGGWCAYAMGYTGEKVSVNPESFSIENGKLYLFYKTFFNDTKAKWQKNTKALKKEADHNWNAFINTSNHENKN